MSLRGTAASYSFMLKCFYWAGGYFGLPWWHEVPCEPLCGLFLGEKNPNKQGGRNTSLWPDLHAYTSRRTVQRIHFISLYLVEAFPSATERGTEIPGYALFLHSAGLCIFSFFILVNLDHFVLKYHFLPDSAVVCMVDLRDRGGDCFLSGQNLMRYAFLSAVSGNKTFL